MEITAFDAASILIVMAALLGYLNRRFIGLPQSVALTLMGAVASLIVIAIERIMPGSSFYGDIADFLTTIDFRTA